MKSCSGSVTVKEDWGISNIYDVRCYEAQTRRDILDPATQINQEVRLFSAGSVSASDECWWSSSPTAPETPDGCHVQPFYNFKFTILNLFCDFLYQNKSKYFFRHVLLSAELHYPSIQSSVWVEYTQMILRSNYLLWQ